MLADAIAGTTVVLAKERPYPHPIEASQMPAALFTWGDAEYQDDQDVGPIRQRTRTLTIEVIGKTREAVDLAIEELQDLWDEQPYRAGLTALNCWVKPASDIPSFEFESANADHSGVLQLDVIYRTAITGV